MNTPDDAVLNDSWSELRQTRSLPDIDMQRLQNYRLQRIKQQLDQADVAMCMLVNPISLRYAIDCRSYLLLQSHLPCMYLFISNDGPLIFNSSYISTDDESKVPCTGESEYPLVEYFRHGHSLSCFNGGLDLSAHAQHLANDIVNYLNEIGSSNRRVPLEYVNPSLTLALQQRGLEVIDAAPMIELARVIKSADEINCIRWAVAVAEHGIAKMQQVLKPGVSELQLWALLNYTNVANDGDWHEGRMLASGPRVNPWLQEASNRRIESGDLVAFDTDMVGPFGYFADISRTFFCGNNPTKRQKQLYRLALDEIEHNLALLRPGLSFREFQQQAYVPGETFQKQAYVCTLHGVGMCDEYPYIEPAFRDVPIL